MPVTGYMYLLLFGVLLPAGAIHGYFKVKRTGKYPPKSKVRTQVFLLFAILLAIGFFTSKSLGMTQTLFPPAVIRLRDLVLGVGTLLVVTVAIYPLVRRMSIREAERVYRTLPQSFAEMPVWVAISISAGIVEEILYRGVLFSILMLLLHSWWLAALIGSACFGLTHFEGWKNIVVTFLLGIILQGIVYATGALYVAMFVHAAYDLIVGVLAIHFWRRFASLRPAEVSAASSD